MAWQEESKYLSEDSAIRISFTENPQTGDAEMVRFWNIDREDLRESLLRFLNTYGSAQSPLVENRAYVDAPKADKKEYSGRWRVVSNAGGRKKTPAIDEIGIVQTLRLNAGYSRLSILSGASCSSKELTDYYYNAPDPGLYAIPSAPANGQSFARDEQTNGDGSFNVQIKKSAAQHRTMASTLVETTGLKSSYNSKELGVTSQSVTDISSPNQGSLYRRSINLKDDCSKDIDTTVETSIPITVKQSTRRTKFICEDTSLYVNSHLPLNAPTPTGTGIYTATQRINDDLTYSGDVTYRVGNNAGVLYYAARRAGLEATDGALYRSFTTPVVAPTPGARGIYDASNSLGDDGLYDSTLLYRRSIANTIYFTSERGPFHAEDSAIYVNSDVMIHAPAATVGLYRASNSLNDDKTYQSTLIYRTGILAAAVPIVPHTSILRNDDGFLYRSSPNRIYAPTAAAGGMYDVNVSVGDDGLYSGELVYRFQPSVFHSFASRRTPFMSEDSLIYHASRTSVDAPKPAVGVYTCGNRENEDGTYDAELVYRIGTGTGKAVFNSRSTGLRSDITNIYRAMVTPLSTPDAPTAQGMMYDANNSLGEDGLYDSSLVYAASIAASVEFSSTNGPLGSEAEAIYRNSRSVIAAPSASTGIYRSSNNLNEDLTYDGAVVYRIGKPAAVSMISFTGAQKTVTLYDYRNQATMGTATENTDPQTEERVSGRMTDDGLYDYTRETSVEKPLFDTTISWTIKSVNSFKVASYTSSGTIGAVVSYHYYYDFTAALYTTPAAAYAAIHGGYEGSHVSSVGAYWMAVKLTFIGTTPPSS